MHYIAKHRDLPENFTAAQRAWRAVTYDRAARRAGGSDPTDSGQMAHALDTLLDDQQLRSHLRSAGLRRVAGFSWDAATRCTWRPTVSRASSARRDGK